MAETPTDKEHGPAPSVIAQLRDFWEGLSPRRRAFIAITMVGTLALFGALSFGGSVETYSPLYSGMSSEEAGEVIAVLKDKGVAYRIGSGGASIEVPERLLHELRMELAASGFPRGGGVGFEIFDKQTFGTTSFVEQVNFRRALQGELTRSITAIAAIKSARIHLAMGKRSVFRDSDEPPSASVALRLKSGRSLSAAEVRGIVHLVASSVDALEPAKVVVIDERGRVLSAGDSENNDSLVSDVQNKIEESLETRVRRMVETVVGVGNAAVVVTAEMDFSRVDKTEEMYDKDQIAIRSEVRNVSRDSVAGGTVGGIAGARANLDGTAPAVEADGGGGQSTIAETRNYEVPRVLKHTVGAASTIQRLHVAVLVNHKEVEVEAPVPTEAEEAATDKGKKKGKKKVKKGGKDEQGAEQAEAEPKRELVPLSPEELAVITSIARHAAGLNDERGDSLVVQNVPFENTEELAVQEAVTIAAPLFSKEMFYAASAVAALLLMVVVLVLMRRKNPTRRSIRPDVIALPAPIGDVERALDARRGAPELPAPQQEESAESHNGDLYGRVISTVRADAGHAARVLSALLDDTAKEGA